MTNLVKNHHNCSKIIKTQTKGKQTNRSVTTKGKHTNRSMAFKGNHNIRSMTTKGNTLTVL